jgi:hypothetical protein
VDIPTSDVPPTPPLAFEIHEYYVNAYSENTIADQGLVAYTKSITADTGGMAATNQYNLVSDKVVEFTGSELGRMTSDESNLLDGTGTGVMGEYDGYSSYTCPFLGSENTTFTPEFCNVIEEGSSVDISTGSLSTQVEERHIMPSEADIWLIFESTDGENGVWEGNIPVSDPGTEANYKITLTGIGQIPASGSADAFVDVHLQEGRANPWLGNVTKALDLVYSESSNAVGDITLFSQAGEIHLSPDRKEPGNCSARYLKFHFFCSGNCFAK